MKRMIRMLFPVLAVGFVAVAELAEGQPSLVPFGGVVVDRDARPRSGRVGLTFALYGAADDVVPSWLETQVVELGPAGSYTVVLGRQTPGGIPRELFTSGRAGWIGVRVDGGEELPRQFLGSVGFALQAANAAALDGLPASAFERSSGSLVDSGTASGSAAAGAASDDEASREERTRPPFDEALSAATGGVRMMPDGGAGVPVGSGETPRTLSAPSASDALLQVAGPIAADELFYNTAKTRHFTLGGHDFTSRRTADPYIKSLDIGQAYISTTGVAALVAPVHLPEGAVLNQFLVHYLDNDPANLTFRLMRQAIDGTFLTLATLTSSGAELDFRSFSMIVNHTVVNETGSYLVMVDSVDWPGTDQLSVLSVRIRYVLDRTP